MQTYQTLRYAVLGMCVAVLAGCGEVRSAGSTGDAISSEVATTVAFPSSAAYDSQHGALLVGSYANGTIERVRLSGAKAQPSAILFPDTARRHVLRIRVDAHRQRIWILAADAIYIYNSRSSELQRRIAIDAESQHSDEHCLPDLTIDRLGNAFISSAIQPSLMRVDAQSLEVTHHDLQLNVDRNKDFGFSALAFAGEDEALFAASASTGALWQVDHLHNRATKLTLSQPVYGACAIHPGLDVQHSSGSPLVLYIAGGFRDGVQRVELSESGATYRVTAVSIPQTVAVPTDFIAVGSKLLVVSSQLSEHPDFNGHARPGSPFKIVPVSRGNDGARSVR